MPMKTKSCLCYLLFLSLFNLNAQQQKSIDQTLKLLNDKTVPYISVDQLNKELNNSDILLLDSRKKEEF